MRLKITTWNVNSVRFRIDLVAKFIKANRPDILCLQETKCPDDKFPMKRFKRLGYEHAAMNGQKGYHGVVVLSRLPFDSTSKRGFHGVVVLSRLPFDSTSKRGFCGMTDSRHISVVLGEKAGLKDPILVHNLYVPAGGDVPEPEVNPKFKHKLSFLDEMRDCKDVHVDGGNSRAILLGDLNVAPREHDVWSHKQLLDVVSHTPIECEKLDAAQKAGGWVDAMRELVPEPTKLYTWWSYRSPDWKTANKGRRLDHMWVAPALMDRVSEIKISKEARSWAKPSDHVPVTATLEI
jgi:exodeoxyribonuclease III